MPYIYQIQSHIIMKKASFFIGIILLISHASIGAVNDQNQYNSLSFSPVPDSISIDTIDFKDMNDTYTIVLYKSGEDIVQMDVDRKGSYTEIDYILWDADRDGRVDAIAVYAYLDQKYDNYMLVEDIDANDLLNYEIQIEDIGFPSFYDSSQIPKVVYQGEENQPELNYFKQ